MSLVGPRPLVWSEVATYPAQYRDLVYRDTTPGITGLGSLFFRNESTFLSSCEVSPHEAYQRRVMPIKGRLEAWYQENRGIRVDLSILVHTAQSVYHSSHQPYMPSRVAAERVVPPEFIDEYEQVVVRV